ncbi:MAG: hemolysin [Flavobacteriaceae bacterium]|nr:MAG: hemolysin [Flavobacteriaceae bacterium]
MTTLLLIASISIFISFLCSILEAVLLSINPTFINIKKKEGLGYAKTLDALKNDIDKPIIAILTLNTLAHTVGAIMVGVHAESLDYDINILGVNIVGIVSAIMTILILVVSEIIPKTIGATYWKQLASFTAKTLTAMVFILKWTGILWTLQLTTKLIGKSGHGSALSREDFSAMAEIATEEGVFLESESTIIKNLINFKDVKVKSIMTPRTVMEIADEDMSIQEFFSKNKELKYSRIPLFHEDSDNITGYFLKDNLYQAIINKKGNDSLKTIKREILVTERNLSIPALFDTLISKREHIALVVDEYGSVSGLVSQEDIIETLLGLEIMDESDSHADLQLLAREGWKNRAKKMGIIIDDKTNLPN